MYVTMMYVYLGSYIQELLGIDVLSLLSVLSEVSFSMKII